MRESEATARSVGKNVVGVRRNIFMFGSGIIAMAGALNAFYFSYVVQANYGLYYWTYWPLLMVIIGGSGNCAGALLGTALVMVSSGTRSRRTGTRCTNSSSSPSPTWTASSSAY